MLIPLPFPVKHNVIRSATFYNCNKTKIVTKLSNDLTENFLFQPNALFDSEKITR